MSHDHSPTLGEILARLTWMLAGPVFLFILAYGIVYTGNGWATPVDFAFFVALAITLAARWFEFLGGHPRTAEGAPATPLHLHRFLTVGTLVGVSVYVLANVLGNYVWVN